MCCRRERPARAQTEQPAAVPDAAASAAVEAVPPCRTGARSRPNGHLNAAAAGWRSRRRRRRSSSKQLPQPQPRSTQNLPPSPAAANSKPKRVRRQSKVETSAMASFAPGPAAPHGAAPLLPVGSHETALGFARSCRQEGSGCQDRRRSSCSRAVAAEAHGDCPAFSTARLR